MKPRSPWVSGFHFASGPGPTIRASAPLPCMALITGAP